jgi:hypothetical protein
MHNPGLEDPGLNISPQDWLELELEGLLKRPRPNPILSHVGKMQWRSQPWQTYVSDKTCLLGDYYFPT